MLVMKADKCEYIGFKDGYHVIDKLNGNIELAREFKLVVDRDTVYIYHKDGSKTVSTARSNPHLGRR